MCGCTYRLAILVPNSKLRTSLGTLKIDQAGLDDRVDDDHFAAAAAHRHQRPHQPRMVAGRIAADDEHQVGLFDVVKLIVAVPLPIALVQPNAAGLMTVVTAVVDIVRAVQPGEKLQQETRPRSSCGR